MHAIILASVLLFAAEAHKSSPLPDQHIAVSAETLAGLPRVSVKAKEHEQPEATYEGVTLGSILERVGVPRGEKLRGAALRNVVVVTATDGYSVVYALPETDSVFTDRQIILADRKDGKPLPEKEGPFRIIAPSEKRPARWIRNVVSIDIKTISQ
jgi:hypothetical protein